MRKAILSGIAVEDGGGMIFDDAVYEDGSPNTTYIWAGDWDSGWNYGTSPDCISVFMMHLM